MTPLAVTAHLSGPITGAPMLDAILAYVVAQRAGLVAGFGPIHDIEIPLQRERGVWLCSSPDVSWQARELRYINRKFPLHEAQLLAGPKLRRVHISEGACKSYRLPGEIAWAKDDAIRWWCLGEREEVERLLASVTHLGKRRAVGRGRVERWTVEPCELWDGFPVLRDGLPLRPLPLDWPGLRGDAATGYRVLRPPYWRHAEEELVAVPDWASI